MHSSNLKLRSAIRLPDEDWTHIQTILHKGTPEQREIAKRIETARTITEREHRYITAADALSIVRDGELEVDHDPIVSECETSPKGAYVQAWLWVDKDKAGIFDVGDSVLVLTHDKEGYSHPSFSHEFTATVRATGKDTDGSVYYTVIDQEGDAFDVEPRFLELYVD
jgi:hypothetical protein